MIELAREAVRQELGEEPVRCRTCRDWVRRSPDLEPWQAVTHCPACAQAMAQAEHGRRTLHPTQKRILRALGIAWELRASVFP